MNESKAERLRNMNAEGVAGQASVSSDPNDPRARRNAQSAAQVFEQFSSNEFYRDSFGRLRMIREGNAPRGRARQQRRKRPT